MSLVRLDMRAFALGGGHFKSHPVFSSTLSTLVIDKKLNASAFLGQVPFYISTCQKAPGQAEKQSAGFLSIDTLQWLPFPLQDKTKRVPATYPAKIQNLPLEFTQIICHLFPQGKRIWANLSRLYQILIINLSGMSLPNKKFERLIEAVPCLADTGVLIN